MRLEDLSPRRSYAGKGTPSGFNTISIGVPSGMYGMSSLGTRSSRSRPCCHGGLAILSPTESLQLHRRCKSFTSLITPGGSSSPFFSLEMRSSVILRQHINLARGHLFPTSSIFSMSSGSLSFRAQALQVARGYLFKDFHA